MRINPSGKVRIRQLGQTHNGIAQDVAIALQVVTALAGKGPCPSCTSRLQRRADCTECRLGCGRVSGIMGDIRMCCIKRPLNRLIIAAFSHRQRHNPCGGNRHLGDQRRVVRAHLHVVDHGADDLSRFTRRVELDQGGQAILRQELRALLRICGAHPCAHNCPIQRQPLLHQLVRIPRLMGPVKVAQPNVDNAR